MSRSRNSFWNTSESACCSQLRLRACKKGPIAMGPERQQEGYIYLCSERVEAAYQSGQKIAVQL